MMQATVMKSDGVRVVSGRSIRRNSNKNAQSALTPAEQTELAVVLSGKLDCMKSPMFERQTAEQQVFDNAPQVPDPNVSWYIPVLERLSDTPSTPMGDSTLTAEQERWLFLRFNYCRFRVKKLAWKLKRQSDDSAALARDLLHWHRRAQRHREQLAGANLGLVLAMIKRMRLGDKLDFSELVSEGNLALLRAVDKFDVSRGFKFSTYACRAIIKAFSRYGEKTTRYRQVFPVEFDPEFEKSDFQETKAREENDSAVEELRRIIKENRADLSPVEQAVIRHRFQLDRSKVDEPAGKSLTLNQVGELVGLTKERVRQIQNKAMEKLRWALEGDLPA